MRSYFISVIERIGARRGRISTKCLQNTEKLLLPIVCLTLYNPYHPLICLYTTHPGASITKDKAKMTGTPSICAVVLWYIHISIVCYEKKFHTFSSFMELFYNNQYLNFLGHNHTYNYSRKKLHNFDMIIETHLSMSKYDFFFFASDSKNI